MIPTKNTNHVAEGKARLTSMFRNATKVNALLGVFLKQVQSLENALWDVINARHLDSDNSKVLDLIGGIVQEARRGRTNAQYRAALKIRIMVLRSKTRAEDLIGIIQALSNEWGYWEAYPAGFVAYMVGTAEAYAAAVAGLHTAKAGGVDARLWFSLESSVDLFVPTTVTTFPTADAVSPFAVLEPNGPGHVGDTVGFYPVSSRAL